MAVLKQRKEDKETCPLYEDHIQLKTHSEENRQMIQNNHLQVISMIKTAQLSHDGLSSSVKDIHNDVRIIVEKMDRAHGLFEAWNMLPRIAKTSIKVLTISGGVAIALKGIIDLFRMFMG